MPDVHPLELSPDLREKRRRLLDWFAAVPSCAIAFSGGVDSSALAKAAHTVLGDRLTAIYLVSETSTQAEQDTAKALAAEIGMRLLVMRGEEFSEPQFVRNGVDRCYHCKRVRFSQLLAWSRTNDVALLIEGSNADDKGDYRPGSRASKELGVRAPLAEIGLTKDEIRQLARHWGLSNHDLPASPCLATRIEYGLSITPERLKRIAAAEAFLASRGIAPVRVRLHGGEIARMETSPEMMGRFVDENFRRAVVAELTGLGFAFVTLDLSGFQSGSMNRGLTASESVL